MGTSCASSRPERPPRGRLRPALVAMVVGGLLAGCSVPTASPAPTTTTTGAHGPAGTSGSAGSAGGSPLADPITWLCRPGLVHDPCQASLTTTVVPAQGADRVVHATDASRPPIDCFYVYPTVSRQTTANANLTVDPAEVAVAKAQASRFSQVCNVYAPMYRQLTLAAISGQAGMTAANVAVAYQSLLAAWRYYLADDNHGRGIAFIGHSQGSLLLIKLLQTQVDPDPTVRSRLVSAMLMGGNVVVPAGKVVGGSFSHIPACTDVTSPGCLIAYSTFDRPPPSDSLFGRVGSATDLLSGQSPSPGDQVACVNPVAGAAPATAGGSTAQGGSGDLDPYFPSSGTPWITYPGLYRATCMSRGGATWLQIDDIGPPRDDRPVVQQTVGPAWGLHLFDVNLGLGNLVSDLRRQAAAYRR